jgi:hypothetical protein
VTELQPTPRQDRVFFSLAGAWFVALTFIGFSSTFYLRALPEPLPTHQIVHGVVYSAWMVLFAVQALLISTRRVVWHGRLGRAAVVLLIVMIPVGFHVVLVKTAAGLKSIDEAGFNLTTLTLGFAFAFAGISNRRRPLVHKRLMLFATLVLTVAAADRVALLLELDGVRIFRKLLAVVPAIALVAYDTWFRRRALLLDLSSLALVWLVIWYTISDVIFLRPAGEALVRSLTRLFV